jgi:hypothetical protein
VAEGTSVGSKIYTVEATDADAGDNGRITFSIRGGSDAFRIDEATGELFTKTVLDRFVLTDPFFIMNYDWLICSMFIN